MSQDCKNLITTPEDINILLVGDSGAGKSTFAHAFANYIKHGQFSVAEKGKVSCPRPYFLKGTVHTQQKDDKGVEIIPTEAACSYVFPLPKYGKRIHLIDTPGFGDAFKDNDNFESILTYINQIERLHAVCFVLKLSNSAEVLVNQYRIKCLLTRLHNCGGKNLFLFTHSRNSCSLEYTNAVLEGSGEQIESNSSEEGVKCERGNVFYLDNEAFCFFVSAKGTAGHGTHNDTAKETYSKIWDHSVAECWKMIEHVLEDKDSPRGIAAYEMNYIVLLHNARKIISQACRLFVYIEDMIRHLERDVILTDRVLLSTQSTHSGQVASNTSLLLPSISSDNFAKLQNRIVSIVREKTAYTNDKCSIESDLLKLARFVNYNAILPCNKSYKDYIKYLIQQKMQQATENDADTQILINNYHDLIKQYTQEVHIISICRAPSNIATNDILESMQQLNKLEDIKQKFETLRQEVITTRK